MADNNKLITNVLLVAAGYLLVARPLLQKLGVIPTNEEIKDANQTAVLTSNMVNQILQTQRPTKTQAEWKSIAEQIYQDLRYSSLDDNKDDAVYQVCRVQNDADMVYLIQFFGSRQEYAFGINNGSVKSLASFLTSNLSAAQLNTIRSNHSRKGLKIKII